MQLNGINFTPLPPKWGVKKLDYKAPQMGDSGG